MIMELRKKSQVTIPKEMMMSLGLKEGDKLDITAQNGMIYIVPVVVYPKKYVDELRSEISDVKDKIKKGKQPTFSNVEDLFKQLDN
ncbi:MAG: AbrB/MazE/SpoVT family DNA-binding domain-containing protein [Eubacteriales bacterium]